MIKLTISKDDLLRIFRGYKLLLESNTNNTDESTYIDELLEILERKRENEEMYISIKRGKERAKIGRKLREAMGLE